MDFLGCTEDYNMMEIEAELGQEAPMELFEPYLELEVIKDKISKGELF